MFLRQVVVLMLKGFLLCFLSSNMFNTFTSSEYVSYFSRKLFDPCDCNVSEIKLYNR